MGQLSCYDQAKSATMSLFGDTDPNHVSMPTQLASATIAGFAAAFLSLPCDLIKSRLQGWGWAGVEGGRGARRRRAGGGGGGGGWARGGRG